MDTLTFDGTTTPDTLKAIPDTPGVYFFLGEEGRILYIGKATTLRDRVRSYFSTDLRQTRGPKLVKMRELVRSVAWRNTESVLEAIVLEAELIRKYQPPYNTDAKDDKSFNHVVITDEAFPRVVVVRGRDLTEGKFVMPIRSVYGPFPHGTRLREAVRIIRAIFPFRDRCVAMSEKTRHRDTPPIPCFQRQIGLCPGVCTGEVSARDYARTIRNIELFFQGKKSEIVRRLTRRMRDAAKRLEFERAGELKKTLFALAHISDVSLLESTFAEENIAGPTVRIEAYDVAHLAGSSTVGVMTVTSRAGADTDEYRKFFLRGAHVGNDLSALEEILRRRMKHREWPRPDIIVVDGNLLQQGVVVRLLTEMEWRNVRVVGVVKNRKHQPERLEGDVTAISEYRREILLANAEAHRFAIGYHRHRRTKDFLP